jgi:hypothetical protein
MAFWLRKSPGFWFVYDFTLSWQVVEGLGARHFIKLSPILAMGISCILSLLVCKCLAPVLNLTFSW